MSKWTQILPVTLILYGETWKNGLMMICWPPRFQNGWCLQITTLKKEIFVYFNNPIKYIISCVGRCQFGPVSARNCAYIFGVNFPGIRFLKDLMVNHRVFLLTVTVTSLSFHKKIKRNTVSEIPWDLCHGLLLLKSIHVFKQKSKNLF